MIRFGGLLTIAVAVVLPGHGTGSTLYPPTVSQAMKCMVDVLATVPGVTAPRAGVMGATPFVAYEWRGFKVMFRALAPLDSRNLAFQTVLNGLATPGKDPDDMGTDKVVALWGSQCQVSAYTLYE